MKKVININFQGQIISIEENAYHVLKEYLDSLRAHFSRERDGDEIVADIETRIAELFSNRLKNGAGCITDKEVDEMISNVGRPEDFDLEFEGADHAESPSDGDSPDEEQASDSHKRDFGWFKERANRPLYRKANDMMIGGVCSGLASYMAIDPVFVRLLFLLFFPVFFWVYVILWIVLPQKSIPSNITKRLYRHPYHRMIGGVCGGIASYFKVEPWVPRIIFIVLFFMSGSGIFYNFPMFNLSRMTFAFKSFIPIYLLLWIIVPLAKTKEQKREMMGEEKYLSSIRNKMGENISEEKRVDDLSSEVDEQPADPYSSRTTLLNAFVIFLKIILFLLIFGCVVAIIPLIVIVLTFGFGQIPYFANFSAGELFSESGAIFLFVLALILTSMIPLIAGGIWFIRRAGKKKRRPLIGIFFTAIWIGSIVLLAYSVDRAWAYGLFGKSSVEEVYELEYPSKDRLYISLDDDFDRFRSMKGVREQSASRKLPSNTLLLNDSLYIHRISLRIRKSADSTAYLRVTKSASIRGFNDSRNVYEKNITYEFSQNDSVLYLSDCLSTHERFSYRSQQVSMTLFVPEHLEVIKEPAVEKIVDGNFYLKRTYVKRKVKRRI